MDEAQATKPGALRATPTTVPLPPEKKRRTDHGIQRFLARRPSLETSGDRYGTGGAPSSAYRGGSATENERARGTPDVDDEKGRQGDGLEQRPIAEYACPRCNAMLGTPDALQSHQDWHFAKALQDEEERVRPVFVGGEAAASGATRAPPKKPSRRKKAEPGQRTLRFG